MARICHIICNTLQIPKYLKISSFVKFLSVKIRISSKLSINKTKIIHQINCTCTCTCQSQMLKRMVISHSFFLLSFSFPGLTQDCLDLLSLYFSYKSTLFCSVQCSGTLVWRYLNSYVIVSVSGALTIVCVWYAAILWYNAHARNVLLWWSHVTAPGRALGDRELATCSY